MGPLPRGGAWRFRDDAGASAVEYAILVAAVAAVIVGIVFAVGLATRASFDDTCSNIEQFASESIRSAADC